MPSVREVAKSRGVDLRTAEKGAREVSLTQRDVILPEGLVVDSIEPQSFVVALGSVLLLFVASSLYWSDAFGAASLMPASPAWSAWNLRR